MNRKIVSILLILVMIIGQCSFSFASESLSIKTNKSTYKPNETIVLNGQVNEVQGNQPVTLVVSNKAGTAVYYIDEIMPNGGGNFNLKISTTGMKEEQYKIKAAYYSVKTEVAFKISSSTNNGNTNNNSDKKDKDKKKNSGGSSSGGGSSTPTEVVKVDDEKTPEASTDNKSKFDEKKLEQAKDLKKNIKNKDPKEATKEVAELAKSLSDELDSSSATDSDSAQVAEEVADLVDELFENPDLSEDQAEEVVTATIETVFKGAMEKDANGANARKLNEKAEKMAIEAVKKAGKVKPGSSKAVLKSEDIKAALENAQEAVKNLKATMVGSGLTKAASEIRPIIDIEVGDTDELKQIALDKDTVDALKTSGAEVEIDMGDMTFKMPAALLESFKDSDVSVESEKLTADEKAAIREAKAENGTDIDIVSDVFEIEFKSDQKDVEIGSEKPQLTIDVSEMVDLLQSHAHKLSVFVYDEQTNVWEHVPSKIVDGIAVFEAPHFSKYAVLKANVSFDDVNGHWAQETIEMMTANQITAGRSEDSFEPDAEITRAEFAAYLVNMLGLEGELRGNFKDVDPEAWYYDSVGLAAINGLVSGVGNGNFAPDATITRQDMAVMMAKAYKVMHGEDMKGEASAFADSILISDYAFSAVSAARYHEIVGGFADGSFRPKQTATRAEAAQMLRSFWEQN